MTNPDKDIFTLAGHGQRMDVKKAEARAESSRRFYQYWNRRNFNLCVDCGGKDGRTLGGKCRCAFCQKKHTMNKMEYRRRTGKR